MRLLRIQSCFNRFYYVTEEDVKLFNRNLLAGLHEDTISLRLLRVARWGLQIIKYFPHRQAIAKQNINHRLSRQIHFTVTHKYELVTKIVRQPQKTIRLPHE